MIANPTSSQTKVKSETDRLVLKTIYDAGPISRAEVVRQTKLTAPTVSGAVARLFEWGLLTESAPVSNGRGKPATKINVIDDAYSIIGIDISNREFKGSIFDVRGNSIVSLIQSVDYEDPDSIFPALVELLDNLVARVNWIDSPLLGIGVGSPGLLNVHDGSVTLSVNVGWSDFPLKAKIEERYNVPVYVVNDSQAAALAQFTFDNPARNENLVVFKIGRGISAGIILDGKIYSGSHFGASEVGHLKVVEDGELCRCGNYGCLETVATSTAILSKAKNLNLFAQKMDENELTTEDVLLAFEAGQEEVVQIVAEAGAYIGRAVASFVSILNISQIVISGSMARFGPLYLESIQHSMQDRALSNLVDYTDLKLSNLGQDIVTKGAASIILHQELGVA
ncbi:MAG: ROK family transcriptional regulator [Chloroflexota bacterium]